MDTKMAKHTKNAQVQTKKKEKEDGCLMVLFRFMVFMGGICAVVFAVIETEVWLERMQVAAYARADSLLFVISPKNATRAMLIFFSIGVIVILALWLWSSKSKKGKIISGSLIASIVTGVILFFFLSFHHYFDVTEDALYYKPGIGSAEQMYSYNDISDVYVTYNLWRGKKNYHFDINYEVRLRNGLYFNAANAWQYAENIVDFDKLLAAKGIPIVRNTPSSSELYHLCDKETGCSDRIKHIYGLDSAEQ